MPDSFKAMGQINGKQYYVPWDWGFTSILYNTDKVPSVDQLGRAVRSDQYKGHISMWDDGPGAVTVVGVHPRLGRDGHHRRPAGQIEQEWMDQKPLNLFYWAGEHETRARMVESGDIWVAYAWQGCYATLLWRGRAGRVCQPQGGPQLVGGPVRHQRRQRQPRSSRSSSWTTSSPTLTCSNAVTQFYYGCANQDVMDAMEDPVLIEAFGIDDPSILETTNFTPLVTDAQRDAWTDDVERGSRPNSSR